MAFPATPLWGTFGGPAISAFPKTARGTSETVSWESKNLPGNPGSDSGRFGPHFRGARSAPEYSGPADAPQSFQKGIRGKLGGRPCDTGLHGARLPARAQPGFVRDARVAGFPSTSSAAAHEIGETPGSHVFAKVSARCFHFFCGIAPLWERSCILFLISVFVRPNWVRHNVGRGSFLMAFHRPPRRATPSEGAARLRSGCAGGRIPQHFFSGRS